MTVHCRHDSCFFRRLHLSFLKGKDTKIPKGTEVTAYVNGDASLDRSKFVALTQGSINELQTQPASDVSGILIKSDPEGAEIMVDGKFVGSTPSTLSLKAGDHTITITKPGHAKWERNILTPEVTLPSRLNLRNHSDRIMDRPSSDFYVHTPAKEQPHQNQPQEYE